MSIQQHLKNLNTWKRGFFILLFAFIYTMAQTIAWMAALFQFVTLLLTGETNPHLSNLGQHLVHLPRNSYTLQAVKGLPA
jgi:uncharacterized protein DUF4389